MSGEVGGTSTATTRHGYEWGSQAVTADRAQRQWAYNLSPTIQIIEVCSSYMRGVLVTQFHEQERLWRSLADSPVIRHFKVFCMCLSTCRWYLSEVFWTDLLNSSVLTRVWH